MALRMGGGHVIGVARQAIADHFGIDFRAAPLGPLIFLKHDHARALAHDEAVAVDVIGSPSLFRAVLEAGRKRARLRESRPAARSTEHTSTLQSLLSTSYAVFCLAKKN